jgi:cytochrome P450
MGKVGISQPEDFLPERWNADNPDVEKLKELHIPFTVGR